MNDIRAMNCPRSPAPSQEGHPFTEAITDGRHLKFTDFASEPFILMNRGVKAHDYYFELCDRYGIEPNVLLETESITTAYELVGRGIGCGMVPDSLMRSFHLEPQPLAVPLADEIPMDPVVAVWKKNLYLSRAASKFIDMLAEQHRLFNSAERNLLD